MSLKQTFEILFTFYDRDETVEIVEVEAETIEAAIPIAMQHLFPERLRTSIRDCYSIINGKFFDGYSVCSEEVDRLHKLSLEACAKRYAQNALMAEKQEYERLKAKFESGIVNIFSE
jgi:hypothetical protein